MSAETMDRIAELRALASRQAYEAASARLQLAIAASSSGEARQHVREALPFLRALPMSLRRLAWTGSFGAPGPRRARASECAAQLWERGIGRSLEGIAITTGAGKLAGICADLHPSEGSELLREMASTEAFTTLLGFAGDEAIAWEGIELALSESAQGCENLESATRDAGLVPLEQAAAFGRWLHAIAEPEAPQVSLREGRLATIALELSCLRGWRRRGCRAHGRWIGERVFASLRQLSRGARPELQLELPACVRGNASTRNLRKPLILDLLSCAVAELSHNADFCEGAQMLAESCPGLMDSAAAELSEGVMATRPKPHVRTRWLQSLLGVNPFSGPLSVDPSWASEDELETNT